MRNTLGFLFVGALLTSAATLAACGGDPTNSNSDDMGNGSGDMTAAATNPCGSAALCTLAAIPDQSLALYDNTQTTFMVTGAPDYSGTVNVTVDRSSIDSISGGKDPAVGVVVLPGTFDMAAGIPKRLDLRFNTTTDAAAFADKTITIHVTDAKDGTKSYDIPFKLTVRPELTITLSGGGATGDLHTWSTDNLADPLTINVRARPVTNSVGGTTFIFLNKDKGKHEIHASTPLTHQAQGGYNMAPNPTTNQPQTPANGGTYQLNAVNDTRALAQQNGAFYCHDHQTFNVMNGDRKVRFIP